MKKILIFHPDIYKHKKASIYTKHIYALLQSVYYVKSLEWFVCHPFCKGIYGICLFWYENPIGRHSSLVLLKTQYMVKSLILLFAKKRKIKIIYAVHNRTPHSLTDSKQIMVYRSFMADVLKKSDSVIVLNKSTYSFLAEEMGVSLPEAKITYLPVGISPKYRTDIGQIRCKYNLGDEDIVFCSIGKIDPYKNIDKIVRAFKYGNLPAKLIIAGKCDEKYQYVINQLIGTDNRIITKFEYLSDEEMAGIMSISDAAILPYEKTSSNSGIMMDAFTNGTTVIGTAIDMAKDFPSELLYTYDFANDDEHIEMLFAGMQRAVRDGKNVLKDKGKQLREYVERENNWKIVEEKLRVAIGE